MNCDINSVLQFFLLYFLLNFMEYILGLCENIFNVLSAYLAVKLVDLQEKIEPKEEKDLNCIGFQFPAAEEAEEEEEDE